MLRFTGENHEGKQAYFLGLTLHSVAKLIANQVIRVNLQELGGPDAEVVLCFGATEQVLFDQLKAADLIPADIEFAEPEAGETEHVFLDEIGISGPHPKTVPPPKN